MKNGSLGTDTPILYELKWDTDYFGIKCGKVILSEPIKKCELDSLKKEFKDYEFISIENRNSEPINSQLIGYYTNAFLADVNIQFEKQVESNNEICRSIEIFQALEPVEKIIEIANFEISKFVEDKELLKRGGDKVYKQWIINSFKNNEKYFAISKNENNEINGFLLYSYSNNNCIIELIAVEKNITSKGVGTYLFKTVERSAYEMGCNKIRVGTQVRNQKAINFYHKMGCKQIGCHQVFHLWNL